MSSSERLIALLAWMKPYRQLGPDINRFQALVADDGDTFGSNNYGGERDRDHSQEARW